MNNFDDAEQPSSEDGAHGAAAEVPPPHPNVVPRGSMPRMPPRPRPSSNPWESEETVPCDLTHLAELAELAIPLATAAAEEEYVVSIEPAEEEPTVIVEPVEEPKVIVLGHRRPFRLVALSMMAAAAGLGGGYALWGRTPATSLGAIASEGFRNSADDRSRARSDETAPVGAKPSPEARPAAAELVAPSAPAAIECRGLVVTNPEGVAVRWGDAELGTTPFAERPIPCGEARVVLEHPRYQSVERTVVARPDAPVTIEVRMERPDGHLELRSVPPGARFTIDGVAIGRDATDVAVRTFSRVYVTATLPGYRPWSRRLYVRGREDSVVVELEPMKRTSAASAQNGP